MRKCIFHSCPELCRVVAHPPEPRLQHQLEIPLSYTTHMHNPIRTQRRLLAFLAVAASVILISSSAMRGQEPVEPPPAAPVVVETPCWEIVGVEHVRFV